MAAEPMPDRIWVSRDDSALGPYVVSSVADPEGLAELEAGWCEYATVKELAARDERALDLEADLREARGEADALRVALSELAHEAREFTTAAEYKVEIAYEEELIAALDHANKLLMAKGDGEGRYELVERSFRGLVDVARRMCNATYPADVFVGGGEATDPGVAFVVKLREALALVEGGGEHGA